MSGTENQPDNPASDAPDNARKAQRPPSLGAELAGSQRAEPMSREDYANFMRREPAADTGEDVAGDGNQQADAQPVGSGDESWHDPAEQAQAATRSEYADQVRQHQNALSDTPSEPVADSPLDARDTESPPAQTGFSSDQLPAGDLGDGRGQDELSTDQSSEDQLADSDNPTPGSAGAHEPTEAPNAPEPGSEMSARDDTDPPGPPDGAPDGDQPDEVQRQFLEKLAGLEQRLREEEIPYALFGSLAASAYIDEGRLLDFHRQHAHDPTERVPDIDLLVPRDSLDRIKPYIG
jgi:hypothetical protein